VHFARHLECHSTGWAEFKRRTRFKSQLGCDVFDSTGCFPASPKAAARPTLRWLTTPRTKLLRPGASFPRPADVAQVEPHGELVDGERGADSVENGHQAAGQQGSGTGTRADVAEPTLTQQQQGENAEHQVMNVATGHHDEMERGDLVRDPEKTTARTPAKVRKSSPQP
jgi:hypothetical protein